MDGGQALEALAALEARESFYAFRQHMSCLPQKGMTLKRGWFQRDVSLALHGFYDDLIAGLRPKLVIEAPPQHGKSLLVTDFIAWLAGKHPDFRTIYTSFSDRLGVRANLRLRRLFASPRYKATFPDFSIGQGGQMNTQLLEYARADGYFRNTTVLGSITGESLDLGVIDDPMKGRDQANSEVYRNKVWDWFTDDFLTRFSEEAGLLCILTRWHVDDPIGRLIDKNPAIKRLRYPAIAECDEEHRKAGEPLFPEHKSLEFLLERKAVMASHNWEALYQQNPMVPEGDIIKIDQFGRYNIAPTERDMIVHSWDTGYKAGIHNDPSVGQVWLVREARCYLVDVVRRRMEYPELKRAVVALADKWTPDAILVEDKASGHSLIQDLKSEKRMPVIAVIPEKDKITRMTTASPMIEAGLVYLPKQAPWLNDLEAEFTQFPNGAHDDQVDALSQFLKWIKTKRGEAAPRIRQL